MPKHKAVFLALLIQLIAPTLVLAGDFDYLKSLSIEAQADPDGFRARLGARFQIGKVQINTVVSNVGGDYADAYMVLRLSEMSGRRVEYVTDHYRRHRGEGWGVLAKDLGIKPGSREFHELKRGHDLNSEHGDHGSSHDKEHGKGRGGKYKSRGD